MTKQKLMNSKQFQIGEQWQHKETLETISIMDFKDNWSFALGFNFVVSYLTEYGIRMNMSLLDFVKQYTYIPHMKGAYH